MKAERDRDPSPEHINPRAEAPRSRTLEDVRCLALLLLVFLLVSCVPGAVRPPLQRGDRSEVQIYLQPVPPEARRLQWTLGDLKFIRSDGVQFPLTLPTENLKGSDLEERQTQLASGFLPPGTYSGVSLTITKASITREDGDAALLVPEDPLNFPGPFELDSSEVLTLFLNLDPVGLVTGGFRFSPTFELVLPSRDLTSLIGYMTLPEADRIMIFNRKTMRVTGALATGRNPTGISVDADRGLAYVAVTGDDAVQIIDVFQGLVRERVPLRTSDGPVDLALTEDGQVLLSANYASDTVSVIDPVQAVETERIQVGRGPTSVIVSRNGTRAYVTCSQSSTLSVIDLSTRTLSATLSLEETTPLTAALDREEESLFIVSGDSPNLTVVDTVALAVTDKIYIGTGSVSIVVDDLSGLALVGRKFSNEVSIVDPTALMPVDTIRLEGAAGHMTIDRQENALLVTIPDRRILQKVNLVSKRVMAKMSIDAVPSEVAVLE
jgi:YVTN family beta-propeller protein